MSSDERAAALEEEMIMIRHSGEIPEVALHNAIHFLCEDAAGPGLALQPEELRRLQQAVVERYRRIILRDLAPRLRDKSIYRGLRRSMINWERLVRFGRRTSLAIDAVRTEVAGALKHFLLQEIADVAVGPPVSTAGCRISRPSARPWVWVSAICLLIGGVTSVWRDPHGPRAHDLPAVADIEDDAGEATTGAGRWEQLPSILTVRLPSPLALPPAGHKRPPKIRCVSGRHYYLFCPQTGCTGRGPFHGTNNA
jgi:hypothetical protein